MNIEIDTNTRSIKCLTFNIYEGLNPAEIPDILHEIACNMDHLTPESEYPKYYTGLFI
jgi:hypothetical protein